MKNRFITVLDVVCEHKIDRKVRISYISLTMTGKLLTSSFLAIKYHCYKTRISAPFHCFINQVFYRSGVCDHGPHSLNPLLSLNFLILTEIL